jgi:hypothetical protein
MTPIQQKTDWGQVQQSIVRFGNVLKSGQGVAVSPRLVITALHCNCDIGTSFEFTSWPFETKRSGFVHVVCHDVDRVDIALLRLDDGQPPFECWLDIMTRPPGQLEDIRVLSLQHGVAGGLGLSVQGTSIYMFDSGTTLCRAQYFADFGLSGCGVILKYQSDGSALVVGVHAAFRHESAQYCLICIASMVPEIMEAVARDTS